MGKKKISLITALKHFKKKNKVEKMYLFGSQATGTTKKWSDVDLLVVSKKFKGKGVSTRPTQLYLAWDLDYPVDFLCYTPTEFKKMKKEVSIVQQAVKKGIEI
jgi:uncharacterized protein